MKASIKKKWVAALRSGEYSKTRKTLRDGDGFCCLGVLCNLHAQAHPKIAATQTNPAEYLGASGFLPRTVMVWAGLANEAGGPVYVRGQKFTLPELNDIGVDGRSPWAFPEIAEIIEEQL